MGSPELTGGLGSQGYKPLCNSDKPASIRAVECKEGTDQFLFSLQKTAGWWLVLVVLLYERNHNLKPKAKSLQDVYKKVYSPYSTCI